MWYKQTFFEWSVRVPLIVSMPQRFKPGRVAAHVSLVDLLPTFLDISKNLQSIEPVDPLDGQSLLPLLEGLDSGIARCVISEYSSEGVCAASRMVRSGHYKYIYTFQLAPMLFDLESDPDELNNLAGQSAYTSVQASLHAKAIEGWDPAQVHADILASQKRRLFIAKVNESSEPPAPNWAYQPFVDETKRYIRGSGTAGPMGKKAQARFPFVPPVLPDRKEDH
jgi:choline-sulfatase